MSEWPGTYVPILGCSEPLCTPLRPLLLLTPMVPAEATMPPFMALIFTPVEVEVVVPLAMEAAAVEITAVGAAQWVENV